MIDVGDNSGAAMAGEFDSSFNFGEHGTRLEITVFDKTVDFGGGGLMNCLLVW